VAGGWRVQCERDADIGCGGCCGGGSYDENVDVDTARLTLEGEGADVVTVTAAEIIVGLYGESFDLAKIWDWNGTAWCNSHTLVGHTSYINSVSIGDVIDGGKNEVVSGSADDSVRIWIGPQSDATPQKGDLNDDGKITPQTPQSRYRSRSAAARPTCDGT